MFTNTALRLVAACWILALAACSSGGGLPGGASTNSRAASTTARSSMDSASAMPGDNASAMPGDHASALPGARLACAPVPAAGTARCTIAINVSIAPLSDPQSPVSLIPGLHPGDIAAAYALPTGASGGVVALVDAYDDPAAESDLAVYRAAFGLPECTTANGCFRKVGQTGSSALPAPDAGWSQEIALDLDMVSAVCPHCRVVLVEANSSQIDDLGAAVDTAARMGVAAVSNSYYATEWSSETSEDTHYRHPGIALTASAGDGGTPSYPAVSTSVIAVGGTTLQGSGSQWSETAWQYGGHGCSTYVAAPSWQPAGACPGTRSAVDVAAVADPQTGVAMYEAAAGGWLVAGGTSVGAPIVAAASALASSAASPAFVYGHPRGFRDVKPAGYDTMTGLGSPAGIAGL